MKAWDIMTVGAVTVPAESKLEKAAQIMIELNISGLPVVDEHGNLVGMLTEGDLLRRKEIGTEKRRPRWVEIFIDSTELAQQYAHERGRRVSDAMSRKVVSLPASASVKEIVETMEKHGYKRIPIVRDHKVVGIVSRANIVRALSRRMDQVSHPAKTDLAIRDQILEELHKTDWAPFGTIEIAVHDGIVDLDGTVTDQSIREALRVAAENAPGVQEVRDNLHVVTLPAGYA
jgi:CBS domain-containing protein